jgi:hypothetical protein
MTVAAHILNCHRTTLHDWVKDDVELKAAIADIRETNVDLAEAKAITKALDEGHPDILRFYLRCFGKDRGWVEVTRIEGADGGAVKVENISRVPEQLANVNLANLSMLELTEFRRLHLKQTANPASLSVDEYASFQRLHTKATAVPVVIEAVAIQQQEQEQTP